VDCFLFLTFFDLNAKNCEDKTIFDIVCEYGYIEISELIIQKSAELNIDLDSNLLEV